MKYSLVGHKDLHFAKYMQNTVKYALQCIQNIDYSGKCALPSVLDDETKHGASIAIATAQGSEKLQEE